METNGESKRFPTAREDFVHAEHVAETPQTRSSAYRLSFADSSFLLREELRPVRLQLELLKPELLQAEANVRSTIVIQGSARIPAPENAKSFVKAAERAAEKLPEDRLAERKLAAARRLAEKTHYYEAARELSRRLSSSCQRTTGCDLVIVTGGGPGIMEAGNRGAYDAMAKSIGLNIVLPHEQAPNPYITPELCFQFHYFAIRKMHFLMRAKALVTFPGGFGTLDEFFEVLTLIQTGKVKPIPIILYGSEFWRRAIDFEFLAEEGVIAHEDLRLFHVVDTVDDTWRILAEDQGLEEEP